MAKRALIVGIDKYDSNKISNLGGCVADAKAMHEILSRHEDQRPNYDCRRFTSPGGNDPVTRAFLRAKLQELFSYDGDVLFYFSGHGSLEETGGFLCTQDAEPGDAGLQMDEVITLANNSQASSILIIIDCCFSGGMGNPAAVQGGSLPRAYLRQGLTILAASRPNEVSMEVVGGQGVFTELVVGALKGGAGNVRGEVSAASIYGYVSAALNAWDQTPIYKSHAKNLEPVRMCAPLIPDDLIRKIPQYFAKIDSQFRLDQTFEETNKSVAISENVATFKIFKQYQIAGLLANYSGRDLYWTAEQSGKVHLTPLGQFYWRLAKSGLV